MEFSSTIDNFQDAILAARPRDIFSFSIRYFRDEKASSPEEAHAIHMLPFLFCNEQEFRSAACTIYCSQINADTLYKDSLDGATVLDIISRISFESLRLKVKVIDEVNFL